MRNFRSYNATPVSAGHLPSFQPNSKNYYMNFLEASVTPLACFFGSAIVVVSILLDVDARGKYQAKVIVVAALLIAAQVYLVKMSLAADTAWISLCLAGSRISKLGIDLLLQILYTTSRAKRRQKVTCLLIPAANAVSPMLGRYIPTHQQEKAIKDRSQEHVARQMQKS